MLLKCSHVLNKCSTFPPYQLRLVVATWAVVTSFAQHWSAVILFFGSAIAAMAAVMCNILTNVNTYVFLTDIATDCFSPIETKQADNACYDTVNSGQRGRSQAQCVCTDVRNSKET